MSKIDKLEKKIEELQRQVDELGKVFKTEKDAKEALKRIQYQQQYKDWCAEKSEPIDWEDTRQTKYYARSVFFAEGSWVSVVKASFTKIQGTIYATSERIITDFIDKIGEENFKKYIIGE